MEITVIVITGNKTKNEYERRTPTLPHGTIIFAREIFLKDLLAAYPREFNPSYATAGRAI